MILDNLIIVILAMCHLLINLKKLTLNTHTIFTPLIAKI